jgi:hypothetical protein
MRVRPFRSSTDTRRAPKERRPHGPVPQREDTPAPVEPPPAPELSAEARLRASGGPDDQAAYQCSCGYVFEADVSTSVSCPHCGTGQAW